MAQTMDGQARPLALVLGAGAQGLTSALYLWADGWEVQILARGQRSETTSWGAGSIWEWPPFQMTAPDEDKHRWTIRSRDAFTALSESSEGSLCGARIRDSYYCFRDPRKGRAAFQEASKPHSAAPGLRESLPPKRALSLNHEFKYGYTYRAPVIDMRKYLPWLESCLRTLGVQVQEFDFQDVAHVAAERQSRGAQLVVNCLGLGAGKVFKDATVYGVLGDKIYVRAPGFEEELDIAQLSDEDHPDGLTYIIPSGKDVLSLAGTSLPVGGEYVPMPTRQAGILLRNKSFAVPSESTDIVSHWAGLRPQREDGVRLELVDEGGGALIHSYGHGGGGVITSWGCASDVGALARQAAAQIGVVLQRRSTPSGPVNAALHAMSLSSRL